MAAPSPAGFAPAAAGRSGAVRASVRRAVPAALGVVVVVVVVAIDAATRSQSVSSPPVFVAYSLLIWAAVPILVTLASTGAAALVSRAEVPLWLTTTVAGVTTAGWVSWAVGLPSGPVYGVVLGLGAAAVGVAIGTGWRAVTRATDARRRTARGRGSSAAPRQTQP